MKQTQTSKHDRYINLKQETENNNIQKSILVEGKYAALFIKAYMLIWKIHFEENSYCQSLKIRN